MWDSLPMKLTYLFSFLFFGAKRGLAKASHRLIEHTNIICHSTSKIQMCSRGLLKTTNSY